MIYQTVFGVFYIPENEKLIWKTLLYYRECIQECKSEEQWHLYQMMIDCLEDALDKLFRVD